MNTILTSLYSWPFAAGILVGYVGQRCYAHAKARYLNAHHPLSNGHRHLAGRINRVWVVGAITAATIGWVLLQIQTQADRTTDVINDARTFAVQVKDCQREFNEAIRLRSRLSEEDSRLSLTQRDALANWLRDLLNPPPNIAALPGNDPIRQQWAVDTTERYYAIIKKAQDDQVKLADYRAAHPLPEPTCGK